MAERSHPDLVPDVSRAEYRDLEAAHRAFEARLSELERRTYLGPEEEYERSRIKKHKLRLKDRMEALLRPLRVRA